MSRPSVLLADDNPAILDHVSKLLDRNQRYVVVGTTTNGAQVQGDYARLRPDVIVLDISMGDFSGLDVARDLRDVGCRAKIVFLTVHEDSDFMNAAMGAGGAAYVVKSRLAIDLIPAIDSVLSGKLFVSASLLHEQG